MKNLELLIPKSKPINDRWAWATVTNTSPLEIRFDGEIDPLPITPDTLVAGLALADRVWVQISGRRVVVLGAAQ